MTGLAPHAHAAPRHTPRPFGRAVPSLDLLAPALVARDDCTCDPNQYHPVCPARCDNCVQRLVALSCGRSCQDNYCVPNPSHSSKGATIGGAVGGVLGGILVALLALWFYRTRSRRRKLSAAHARNEARLRAAAAEKFRPGAREAVPAPNEGQPVASGSGTDFMLNVTDVDPPHPRASPAPGTAPSLPVNGPGASSTALVQPEAVPDEETEYTELRPDGLTMYRHEEEEEDEVIHPNALEKRFSTSAATHLSRISERTECEDDFHSIRSRGSRATNRGAPNWSHLPPMPSPAQRSVLPVPSRSSKAASERSDPFGDHASIPQAGPRHVSPQPNSGGERSPTHLGVPGADAQRRLSTGTNSSSNSAISGVSANTAVPATVTRVQVQKPGKVELVRRPSANRSTASADGQQGDEATPKPAAASLGTMPSPGIEEMTTPRSAQHVFDSDPFEDPRDVVVVAARPDSQGGANSLRSMESGSTGMSASSFAIPLIDTSKSKGESKVAHLHATDGTPLAPASASTGAAGPGLGLALGPLQEEGTTAPASHARSDSEQTSSKPKSTVSGKAAGTLSPHAEEQKRTSTMSGVTTAGSVAGLSMFEFQVPSSGAPSLPQDAAQAIAHARGEIKAGDHAVSPAANTPREADDEAYTF